MALALHCIRDTSQAAVKAGTRKGGTPMRPARMAYPRLDQRSKCFLICLWRRASLAHANPTNESSITDGLNSRI